MNLTIKKINLFEIIGRILLCGTALIALNNWQSSISQLKDPIANWLIGLFLTLWILTPIFEIGFGKWEIIWEFDNNEGTIFNKP